MSLNSRAVALLQEQYRRILRHMRLKAWFIVAGPILTLLRKISWTAAAESRHARRRDCRNHWLVHTLEPRVMLSGTVSDTSFTFDSDSGVNNKTVTTKTTETHWSPELQTQAEKTIIDKLVDSWGEIFDLYFTAVTDGYSSVCDAWREHESSGDTHEVEVFWKNQTIQLIGGQLTLTAQESGCTHTKEGDTSHYEEWFYANSPDSYNVTRGSSSLVFRDEGEHFDYGLETKDKLGCDLRTVYRWADDGKMPWGSKCGGLRRWWEREIDAWIAGGCKPVRELESANAIVHN